MAEYIDRHALKNDGHLCYHDEKGNVYYDVDHAPAADVVEIPQSGIGDLSDGYHTFNELYHHRAVLFSVICNSIPDKSWKSKLHDTGDMYDGMFIVGIETPSGQATYHYDIDPYWDMFKVKELEKAPKWDGHTPQEAIERISALAADVVEVDKVAEMLRLSFGDNCACNFNGNDEWLWEKCKYAETDCPTPKDELGCWKEYVKAMLAKMDGKGDSE